jgi:hypothetical protein
MSWIEIIMSEKENSVVNTLSLILIAINDPTWAPINAPNAIDPANT